MILRKLLLKVLLLFGVLMLFPVAYIALDGDGSSALHAFDSKGNHLYFMSKGFRGGQYYDTWLAYKETGILFTRKLDIQPIDGKASAIYLPVETYGDDLGMYIVIPVLSMYTGFHYPIAFYWLITFGLAAFAFCVGILGVLLLTDNVRKRYVSIALLFALFVFSLFILEVYVWMYLIVSLIPLLLWIYRVSVRNVNYKLLVYTALNCGLLFAVANIFRSHASTGLLFIVISFLFLNKSFLNFKKKILLVAMMLIFMPVGKCVIGMIANQRDEKLSKLSYDSVRKEVEPTHVFWHSLYVGLAIKDNPYGIIFSDRYAFRQALMKDSTVNILINDKPVYSAKYEKIMNVLFMNIVKVNPFFVVKAFFVKFWCVALQIMLFFNYGLWLLYKRRPKFVYFFPLLIGVAFYALPGIICWYFPMYILGALSLALISTILLILSNKDLVIYD